MASSGSGAVGGQVAWGPYVPGIVPAVFHGVPMWQLRLLRARPSLGWVRGSGSSAQDVTLR